MKNKFLNYTFFCFIFLNNIIIATDNINGQQAATTTTASKPIENGKPGYFQRFLNKSTKNLKDLLVKDLLVNNPNLLKYTKRTGITLAGLGIAAYGANEGYKSYNNKGFIFDTLNKIKNKEIFDLTDKNDKNKKDDQQKNNNDQQSDVNDKNISNKGEKNNNASANKSITAGTIAAITTATAAISLAIIYVYKKITDYKNSKKTKVDVNQNTKTVKYKAVA